MLEFFGAIYDILVTPVVMVVDLSFSLLCRALANPGLAIVGVSIVVNLLCLPLYRMADRVQREERRRQAHMRRWVEHIRRSYTGDERYMMLSTYYRQQHYKPVYALSSSVSLLLQVPVFIAAYSYLSSAEALSGAPFLFLSDLGVPDQLVALGPLTINVMPIVMTALNCVSTAVYTRDLALRDKLQAYGLALLFLVLLYQSPSGLVLYWTCNQVFSLVRNLVDGNPRVRGWRRRVLGARGRRQGRHARGQQGRHARVSTMTLRRGLPGYVVRGAQGSFVTPTFLLASMLVACLVGLLVPSAFVGASPEELATTSGISDLSTLVIYPLCVAVGLFVVWVGIYFALASPGWRRAIAYGMMLLAGIFLVDYFLFGEGMGFVGADLLFDTPPTLDVVSILLNIAAIAVALVGLTLLWGRAHRAVNPLLAIMLAAVVMLSVPNIISFAAVSADGSATGGTTTRQAAGSAGPADGGAYGSSGGHEATTKVPFDDEGRPIPIINLSRNGRNVVVLFLDRGIGSYVPFIMHERPDLMEAFDGFTYYHNTMSFGQKTVFGSASMLGSYEYTPAAMNARTDMRLVDKHNEALRVLPLLFSGAGYDVTMLDVPLPNYVFEATDFSIFDDIDAAKAYRSAGAYTDWYLSQRRDGVQDASLADRAALLAAQTARLKRNTCYYSLLRLSPTFARVALYDEGEYLAAPGAGSFMPGGLAGVIARSVLETFTEIGGSFEGYGDVRALRHELVELGSPSVPEGRRPALAQAADEYRYVWPNERGRVETEAPEEVDSFVGPRLDAPWVEEPPAEDLTEAVRREVDAVGGRLGTYGSKVPNHIINNESFGWYTVLASLSDITEVDDEGGLHYVMVDNNTTHTADFYQMPDYTPGLAIDNTPYDSAELHTVDGYELPLDDANRQMHYQSNMAAYLRIADWLNYLKEEGVYDNTRIIVVSDHGHPLGQFDSLLIDENLDAEGLNAILMVKDFDAHGFTTVEDFMTNADMPLMALAGIVDNPVNPATGVPLTDAEKYAHDQIATSSINWQAGKLQTGTAYDTSDGYWYGVHDNIFDRLNWTMLGAELPLPQEEPSAPEEGEQ